MSSDPARNAVLSPVGVGHGLGMLRMGARGSTATMIDAVLGVPGLTGHSALSRLTWQMLTGTYQARRTPAESSDPQPATLRIASGLFIDHTREVDPAYLRAIWSQYALGLHAVNFGSPRSAEAVKNWITDKTGGRIASRADVVQPGTHLVLRSTTHLSAGWQAPFDPACTEPGAFTRADGSTVEVPMMRTDGWHRYASTDAWQAVELSFAGLRQALWLLLPAAGRSATAVVRPDVLAETGKKLRPAQLELAVPRWAFTAGTDLREHARQLGLTDLFRAGANLGGLSEGPGSLWLDRADHDAHVLVNEDGADPPAGSGPPPGTAAGTPSQHRSDAWPEIRIDRPFGFAVLDLPTGLPLLLGHVADPAAGQTVGSTTDLAADAAADHDSPAGAATPGSSGEAAPGSSSDE